MIELDWDAVIGAGASGSVLAIICKTMISKGLRDLEKTIEQTHDHDIRITRLETRHEINDKRRDQKASREAD